ncbi:MAG: hypothetical protein GY842_22515 [bacterium]|nr:hypothetical protein [bacterium]
MSRRHCAERVRTHHFATIGMLLALLLAGMIAIPTSAAAADDATCTAVEPLLLNTTLRRQHEIPPAEPEIFRLPIPSSGVLALDVFAPIAAEVQPRLVFLGTSCTWPAPGDGDVTRVPIAETPQGLVLRIVDRTTTLVIDNGTFDSDGDGDGDLTEYHRVATGSGRVIDTNGDDVIAGDDRRVVFDADGVQVGITLAEALDALGLHRLDEDDTPTSSLSDAEQETSYSTRLESGFERIYRIRKTAKDGVTPKAWEIITPTGIDLSIGVPGPDTPLLIASATQIDDSDFVTDPGSSDTRDIPEAKWA